MARRRAGLFEAPSSVVSAQRVESGVPDTSHVWRELGRAAKGINDRLQPALNQYAEAQARRDFEAGDIHQRVIWNAEDEAYNNAMAQSYLLRAETDIEQRAAEIETEHGLDVEAYDQAFDAMRGPFIANAPEDFALHTGALLDREHAAGRQRIGERRRAAAVQQLQQDGQARLAHAEARLSGFTDLTSPEFAEAWEQYAATGEALAANPLSGFFPEEWALRRDNTLSRLHANTAAYTAEQMYEDGGANAESAAAAIGFLEQFSRNPALTLTEAQRDAFFGEGRRRIQGLERERLRAMREARAEMRQYRLELREEARDTIAGFQARGAAFEVVPEEEIDGLRRVIEDTGSAALARQFNEIVIHNNVRQRLQGLSLAEIESELDALQSAVAAGGEQADDAAVALAGGRAYAQHLRSANPLDAAQTHFGEAPPPLAQGLGPRIRYAEHAADQIGAAERTYFQRGEREQLAGIARAGGEEALALAREIVGAAFAEEGDGFARAQTMLNEIAGSGGEGLAAAGTTMLLGGEASAPTARYMMDAQRLRGVEGYQRPDFPGVDDGQQRLTMVQQVLGDRSASMSSEAGAQLQFAADLVLEGMIAEDPSRLREWRTLYPRAVRMAAGEVRRDNRVWGGVVEDRSDNRIIIPNWIRADQWSVIRSSLGVWDYAEANGGAGPNAPLQDLRNAYLIPFDRPGRYYLSENANGDGYFTTASGARYVLDLNRIRDRLAARRPDAVAR